MSSDKDKTAARKAAEDALYNINIKIADAQTTASNTIDNSIKNILKGTGKASDVSDAYNKLQETFSKTISDSLSNINKDVDIDKIKQAISKSVEDINSKITNKTNELRTKIDPTGNTFISISDTVSRTKNALNSFKDNSNKLFPKSESGTSGNSSSYFDFSIGSIFSELSALYNSDNMFAKLTFLLLILFLFILLLRIGTSILTWALSHSTTPILLDGMINSKQMVQIPQNPAASGAIPILRSNNEDFGIGFTWSVWINIDDLVYNENKYKHIFHKGNDNIESTGMNFPNNSPGLYIAPNTNELVVIMNTFNSITEEVKIKNIPLNKWVCVIIRVNEQKQMDVYINGTLTRRHILPSIPKQNYGDVYVSMNGGFSGHTASLRYYAHPIGTNEIQSIVNLGPNTKMISSGSQSNGDSMDYLATRWFFQPNM